MAVLAGSALSVMPRECHAGSGNFLETIGVSTIVGAILGASTLPFYDQPGKHVGNIGLGAAAGSIVGLGIWVAGKWFGSDEESAQATRFRSSEFAQARSGLTGPMSNDLRPQNRNPLIDAPAPALLWAPMVSLNW